ncbi:MAG: glycosyltransferase family 2 protein [Bacteroidota bacterium]
MFDYTVIVPVYNSAATLNELYKRIDTVFLGIQKSYEIIFIDDGSPDESWDIIRNIKNETKSENITGIKLSKNFGQHNAVFCGLEHAKGNAIITIDDDLQIPPEEIPKLLNAFEDRKCELVYGYFKKKHHSLFRNMGSWYIKKTGKIINKAPGEGSSFRVLSKKLAEQILKHSQEFVYIDELLLWYTNNISFIPVEHERRKYKKSGYSTAKLFQITFNLMIYYTAVPLKMMIYGGFASALLSFIIGLYYILKKVFFHHAPPGYTSIIVAILFSTSIIIFNLGIIGEYLHRIYKVQNKKPPYSIKEKI